MHRANVARRAHTHLIGAARHVHTRQTCNPECVYVHQIDIQGCIHTHCTCHVWCIQIVQITGTRSYNRGSGVGL
jgi:hypothetical protein